METTWDGLPIARENPRAASVVVWRAGEPGREYLLLHRHHHGPDYAGDWAWTPPSGARQPGESPEEAARRELREETGLDLHLEAVAHVTDEVALFQAEAPADAVVRIDPEHDAYVWAGLEEAVARCLPPIVGESIRQVDARLAATWAWDPETYLATMLEEIPGYGELQDAVVQAAEGAGVRRVLELGTGTGETALRVLARLPGATWVGIDASEPMLARARQRLPRADLRLARLEGALPAGPFDLVVSVLAVHHLDGAGKRALFARVADVLGPGGRFVLGDVVVPADGVQGPIEIDGVVDLPDTVDDQLAWLRGAGFVAEASLVRVDLAVFDARVPARE